MQRLHRITLLLNLLCKCIPIAIWVSLLLYMFLNWLKLYLRMVIRQACHVPILMLYLVDLAYDGLADRWVIGELEVDQVARVILVERHLLENYEFSSQVLQPFINQLTEILRDSHILLRFGCLLVHRLVLLISIVRIDQEGDGA